MKITTIQYAQKQSILGYKNGLKLTKIVHIAQMSGHRIRILFGRRQSLDKDRIISILTDVNARLIESTRYNMDFAEHEIKDCVSLIDVVIKEMNENSTNTI